MVRVGVRLALVAAVVAGVLFVSPTAASAQDDDDDLIVVTTELTPFVVRDGNIADGFYFEIWEDVAAELGVNFDVVWADSFGDMLAMLESGEADVAVAPLAPTAEREERLDFTSAVVASGPQLGVHDRTETSVSIFRTLVGSGALRVLLYASLGLVLLGHVIWLVERNDEEGFSDFHASYPRGVWDGIWWAAVTVTTVGYGDTAPKSGRGRLIAMVAMLASLFLVGAFVSQVSSDLEEGRASQGIEGIEDLGDRAVAVVEGSTFATYIEGRGVETVGFESQGAAFDAVEAGDLDVVLANPFAIATIGEEHGINGAGSVLYEEFETFGLQQGSPWREPINGVLAQLQATGRIQRIIDRWN